MLGLAPVTLTVILSVLFVFPDGYFHAWIETVYKNVLWQG